MSVPDRSARRVPEPSMKSWRDRSLNEMPALGVGGPNLRRSLRLVTAAWMFGIVWISTIGGSQMTYFQKLLGLGDFEFGLCHGIALAASLLQLVSTRVIERTGVRKYQFIVYATFSRLMWLAIAAIPLVFRPGSAAATWVFIGLFAAWAAPMHLSVPAWQNWMGDMIPRRIRGRYFANRRVWTIPIQIVTVIAIGLILNQLVRKDAAGEIVTPINMANQPDLLGALCVMLAIGAVFGTIDILLFLRLREVASPALARPAGGRDEPFLPALLRGLAQPFRAVVTSLKDRSFAHFALYSASITFAAALAMPFFQRNALENLKYTPLACNLTFVVGSSLAALAMMWAYGRLLDRWGRRPMLLLCTALVSLSPLGWFFIPVGAPMWVAYVIGGATAAVGGAMWSGIDLARFNMILNISQGTGRSRYLAAAAVFTAFGGLAGGTLGGTAAEALSFMSVEAEPLRVGPFRWTNWHATFLMSSIMRASSLIWLIGMPDPGARPLGEMVRSIRTTVYHNTLPRLNWPARGVRGPRWRETPRRRPEDRPEDRP
jgi:hypothetical protein